MAAFAHLVRMLGRAFYTDVPGDERKALAPHALVPMVLDAMTRREWVKEDNLAGELGLHPKQIRKVLRFLHEEQLICREFRKERGVAEGDAPAKSFTHSYSCLDYSRCVDVARYRLHFMVKDIKAKLDEKDKVSTYRCKRCGAAYTSFDIMGMVIDPEDFSFHCERCGGALEDEEGDELILDDELEAFVLECVKARDPKWLPMGRALCLPNDSRPAPSLEEQVALLQKTVEALVKQQSK